MRNEKSKILDVQEASKQPQRKGPCMDEELVRSCPGFGWASSFSSQTGTVLHFGFSMRKILIAV